MMLVRVAFVAALIMVAVFDAPGQCRIDTYALIANSGEQVGTTEILPGLNGEIYLLIGRGTADTLSNGAYSDTRGHFLLKYDSALELQWWRDIRSWNSGAMMLDSNGNILLSGISGIIGTDTLTRNGVPFIARLNGNGDVEKILLIRNVIPISNLGTPSAVSRDGIYYVGYRADTVGISVVKMDYDGNMLWMRYGEPGYRVASVEEITSIAVDAAGNVYVAGGYQSEIVFGTDTLRAGTIQTGVSGQASFIAGWSSDGEYRWSVNQIRSWGDLTNWSYHYLAVGKDNLYVFKKDPDNARFIQGGDTIKVGPYFIASFDLEGDLQWVRSYDIGTTFPMYDMAIDASGSVVVSLPAPLRRVNFHYGDHDSLVVDPGGYIILVHDRDGNMTCAKNFPNASSSRIGADRKGTVHMGGLFGEYTVFNGTDTIRSSVLPRQTLYIARLGSQPSRAPLPPGSRSSLSVYPNPSAGTVTLSMPESAVGALQVHLTDMLGTVVQSGSYELVGGSASISVSDLPSGIYLLRATGSGIDLQERIVIAR
jgi:hypothetical protein